MDLRVYSFLFSQAFNKYLMRNIDNKSYMGLKAEFLFIVRSYLIQKSGGALTPGSPYIYIYIYIYIYDIIKLSTGRRQQHHGMVIDESDVYKIGGLVGT